MVDHRGEPQHSADTGFIYDRYVRANLRCQDDPSALNQERRDVAYRAVVRNRTKRGRFVNRIIAIARSF